MYKNKKILAVIPARKGSKRIKNKNFIKINNKRLIDYTFDSLKKSKLVDYCLLSSDTRKAFNLDIKYHFIKKKIRPKKYSGDKSTIKELLIYLIKNLKKEKLIFDYICVLQPTSPFRKNNEIDNAIKKIIDEKSDSLLSLTKIDDPHPFKLYKIKNKKVFFFKNYKYNITPRQLLPDYYMPSGNIYIFKTNLKENIFGKKISFYEIKKKNYLNIDNLDDLLLAKKILKNQKKKFNV